MRGGLLFALNAATGVVMLTASVSGNCGWTAPVLRGVDIIASTSDPTGQTQCSVYDVNFSAQGQRTMWQVLPSILNLTLHCDAHRVGVRVQDCKPHLRLQLPMAVPVGKHLQHSTVPEQLECSWSP